MVSKTFNVEEVAGRAHDDIDDFWLEDQSESSRLILSGEIKVIMVKPAIIQ